jgi:hypothetical protein
LDNNWLKYERRASSIIHPSLELGIPAEISLDKVSPDIVSLDIVSLDIVSLDIVSLDIVSLDWRRYPRAVVSIDKVSPTLHIPGNSIPRTYYPISIVSQEKLS